MHGARILSFISFGGERFSSSAVVTVTVCSDRLLFSIQGDMVLEMFLNKTEVDKRLMNKMTRLQLVVEAPGLFCEVSDWLVLPMRLQIALIESL